MNWTSNFDQLLRQISEFQRDVFTTWTSAMPTMQESSTSNLKESFDNTLKLQEDLVAGSLELQALLARLSLDVQKQWWESYFNTFRRS